MTTLHELVEAAIQRREMDGISGWGLNNPDESLFYDIATGPAVGCDSDTCNHVSHSPSDRTYKLIPRRGQLVSLGSEGHDDRSDFYAVVEGEVVLAFVEVRGSRAYHDDARIVEEVPDWALLELTH